MDKRLTFNEDEHNYDAWRPTYCDELFARIIEYGKINAAHKAVEVGPGTGQATTPMLKTGMEVTAVEYGEKLAAFCKKKFSAYPNFHIVNAKFEEFTIEDNSVELVYSATAFHWIDQEIGYPKVFDMLKSGGTIALFWNRPFCNRADDALHQQIQVVYDTYQPSGEPPIEHDLQLYQSRADTIRKYGFVDLEHELFERTRTLNAQEYVCLMNTYSNHRQMPEMQKLKMEEEMMDAIRSAGDVLHIYDTMDLHVARKP